MATSVGMTRIQKLQEIIRANARSEVFIEIDNHDNTYPVADIDKGHSVAIQLGCATSGGNEYATTGTYFVEDWTYLEAANRSNFLVHAIDLRGLMEMAQMPSYMEFNLMSNTYTSRDIIEKMVEFVGGTLDVTLDGDMSDFYPHLTVQAGESAARIVDSLLEGTTWVMRYSGLTAYLIDIASADASTYTYYLPYSAGNHNYNEGKYKELNLIVNRYLTISQDADEDAISAQTHNNEEDETGVRLEVKMLPYYVTSANLATVNTSMIDKDRLKTKSGYLMGLINVGQELWDVITLNNTRVDFSSVKYRVYGIQNIYDPSAKYKLSSIYDLCEV